MGGDACIQYMKLIQPSMGSTSDCLKDETGIIEFEVLLITKFNY